MLQQERKRPGRDLVFLNKAARRRFLGLFHFNLIYQRDPGSRIQFGGALKSWACVTVGRESAILFF